MKRRTVWSAPLACAAAFALLAVVCASANAEDAAPSSQPAPPPAPPPAAAQPLPPDARAELGIDFEAALAPVKNAVSLIDALEHQVEAVRESEPDLSQRRIEVGALLEETEKAAGQLRPLIDQARQQLAKLGPKPGKNDPADAPEVAAQRTRLSAVVAALEGGSKSVELVKERGRQLGFKIQEMRHSLFAQRLFERTQSPLLPQTWQALWNDVPAARTLFLAVFGTWQTIIMERWPTALAILGTALFAFGVLRFVCSRAINRMLLAGESPGGSAAGYTQRASAACLVAPLIAIPSTAAVVVAYTGFEGFGLVYSRVEEWLQDAFHGALILVIAASLATAILEPKRPLWRLVDLRSDAASALWRTLFGFACVYAADVIAKQTIRLLELPLPFSVALSFITSLALAGLLIRAALTRFVPNPVLSDLDEGGAAADALCEPTVPRLAPRWLKLPLLLVAAAILIAALTGYVALGRFVAGQVVITGSAAVLAILLHLTFKTVERSIDSEQSSLGIWLTNSLGYESSQRQLIGQAVSVLLHVAAGVALIPGVLLAWGFSSADVLSGLKSALFGFEIGRFKISLVQILLALVLFAGIVLATRLMQRWLQKTVLRPDRLDPGIANSIHQGLGYAGFALALLAGVSFGGIDITNLAIVAGALSVGIGFGLQSIVNNFVSGLILLVERPIKVGDWIVVKGGGEGYVRAISVRSTEIETFDRASLIVPNSELISNVVTNWTHRNALGRVVIKVAASYKSDPSLILKVLNDVAVASPLVMQQPPPLISLDNLGPDGLEFSVRVLVADINRALGVQTMLRAAIVHAFKQNGIEFPTPERDLYLRDLDGLKALLARTMDERARQQAASASVEATVSPEDKT